LLCRVRSRSQHSNGDCGRQEANRVAAASIFVIKGCFNVLRHVHSFTELFSRLMTVKLEQGRRVVKRNL